MPERGKFNPLDPLGLFQKTGTPDAPGSVDIILSATPHLPRPPDPLGIFGGRSSNPGNPGRSRLPDPLGLLTPGVPGDPGRTIGNPIPIEFDGHLVDIKKQAREKLIARGYAPQRVDMALHWAEEWLLGMARRMAPGNMELQKTVVQSAYAEIASRSERWLQGIEAAFAVGGPAR